MNSNPTTRITYVSNYGFVSQRFIRFAFMKGTQFVKFADIVWC